MSAPPTASASKSTSSPLQDDELSELTKKEIIFWSNKLKVTPSQLFSLTRGELDILLQNFLNGDNSRQQSDEEKEHEKAQDEQNALNEQREMKQQFLKKQQKGRLKGGAGNDIWDILGRAARDIENMYGQSTESFEDFYDDAEESYGVYTEDEASLESTAEDISFNMPENMASTPNRTYCVPPRNATFTCPNSSYNLSTMSSPSGMACSSSTPKSIHVDSWSPQQWAHVSGNCANTKSQSFRNYTDYSIKYGPTGTKEASSSISVENFDDSSGQVTASSRTFTLPPATSATSAIMLSKISPPQLASGVAKRCARQTVVTGESNLSNISQPPLASGCRRHSPRSGDLSNITPPSLASGCRRNRSPSPLFSNLSNMTPPALASGCGGRSPQSVASGAGTTECSINISNISPPSGMTSPNYCPHLAAALRAQTPMRYKPNRPYYPRRIC